MAPDEALTPSGTHRAEWDAQATEVAARCDAPSTRPETIIANSKATPAMVTTRREARRRDGEPELFFLEPNMSCILNRFKPREIRGGEQE
ncbi:hypothetical protein CWS72_24850 [Telmatospirillum siberiense]|uniref:Uncharacterized protein n=1 Tax=Telmatospirillum siberiense TaxID=382514 RepID=A0A2N3PN56_9PROT|nr:hypothetical protein CWS72_24850 [Telmatospirillum siberiense]